jgi:hypothetical protein
MPLFTGGNLLWTLNDIRCVAFTTCGPNGDQTTGTAKVRASRFKATAAGPLLHLEKAVASPQLPFR